MGASWYSEFGGAGFHSCAKRALYRAGGACFRVVGLGFRVASRCFVLAGV